MDDFVSFILTIVASVVCHCINKWLDGDEQSVTSLWTKPPQQNKRNRKTPGVPSEGFSLLMNDSVSLSVTLQHMYVSETIYEKNNRSTRFDKILQFTPFTGNKILEKSI